MSYSTNWSISGVTGLTSLKECYKWNNENRLYNFGMLRLKDDEVQKTDNTIRVLGGGRMPVYIGDTQTWQNNYANLKYYTIPSYLINNCNIAAIGHPGLQPYEQAYQHSTMAYDTNHSPSQIKNGNYGLYPTIIECEDSFTDGSRVKITKNQVAVQDNIYYKIGGNASEGVAHVQDLADKSRFIIASYYHTLDPNWCSNDEYDLYPVGSGGTTGANFDFYSHWYFKLRNGARSAVQYEDLNGYVYSSSSNEYQYFEGFFHQAVYLFSEDAGGNMYLASDLSYGSLASQVHKQPGYLVDTPFDRLNLGFNFGIQYQVPVVLPYYYNTKPSFNDVVSYSLDYENKYSGATTFPVVWDISVTVDGILSCRTNGRRNLDVDYDVFDIANESHSYVQFTGTHEYIFNQATYNGTQNYSGGYELDTSVRPGYTRLEVIYSYWRGSTDTPGLQIVTSGTDVYTCPIILSAEPALVFTRTVDSRNNNTYCYKVIKNYETATVASTGGTIDFDVYMVNGGKEHVSLTLTSDSGSTSTTLSNGGCIYGDGPSHGQVTDGCIVYAGPQDSYGNWQGFGPSVGLHPMSFTPTYYSTSAGGGMYRYFGWRGSNNFILYGKLTNYIDIDGTISKYEDSSARSFTYLSPIYDSVQVQDPVSGDAHIATLVYSELQGGYSADQLSYTETRGTLPIKTVVITSENNGLGTLTYSGNGTSTTVQAENGNVTIVLNGEDLPQTFTITNVSPKAGYGYTGNIASYYGNFNNFDTFYLTIDGFNVADFSHVYIVENYYDGGSSDPSYYSIDVENESGYIISYTGFFYKGVNNILVRSQCSDNNVRNLSTITYVDSLGELEYAEVVYTNGSQSRTLTYGTAPRELSITNHVLGNNSNYNPENYEGDGNQEYAEYYEVSSLPGDGTGLQITFNGTDYYLPRTSNRFLAKEYYYSNESSRLVSYKLVFDTAINRIFVDYYDSGDISEEDGDSYNYGSGFTISKVVAIR